MITLVRVLPKKHRKFSFSLHPYHITTDFIGEESVLIYNLRPWLKPLFPKILKHLKKKHPDLIDTEQPNTINKLFPTQLYPKLKEIFTLINAGTPQSFAILCHSEEEKLLHLLEILSPFARTVSLVTDNPSSSEQTETVLQTALENYGLTVTQRSINQLGEVDLLLLVSGQFDLSAIQCGNFINLSGHPVSVSVPMLTDFAAKETTDFLSRHPELFIKHAHLLPQNAKISRLIWQYC